MLKKPLSSPNQVVFGPFRLDREDLFLLREGKVVDIPRRSLALLVRLLERPGGLVSRRALVASVWDGTHVSPTSLVEAMSRLRQALDDDARRPRYVQTVRGRGYRFIATVESKREPSRRRLLEAAVAAALVLALAGVFLPGGERAESAVIAHLSASGRVVRELALPPLDIGDIALAPDGRRVALSVESGDGSDIWVFDPAIDSLVRITESDRNFEMVWSSDGEWLVYATDASGSFDLVRRRSDGRGPSEVLLSSANDLYPESFASDGRSLVYSHTTPGSGLDLATLSVDAQGVWTSRPLRATRAHEYLGALSPHLDALAFVSNESGSWEAYVQQLEPGADPVRISRGGVRDVFWAGDGRAVLYLEGGRLFRVPLDAAGLPEPDERRLLETPVRIARVAPAAAGGFVATVF